MRIGAEEHLAGPDVPFLGQSRVADAREGAAVLALELAPGGVELPLAVGIVDHVIEIGQVLFAYKVAQDVYVTVREAVRREDVVVGDDDDLVAIPDLGVASELAVEHADGARPAHVVREEDVRVDPEVVAGVDLRASAGPGEDGFGERHLEADWEYAPPAGSLKAKDRVPRVILWCHPERSTADAPSKDPGREERPAPPLPWPRGQTHGAAGRSFLPRFAVWLRGGGLLDCSATGPVAARGEACSRGNRAGCPTMASHRLTRKEVHQGLFHGEVLRPALHSAWDDQGEEPILTAGTFSKVYPRFFVKRGNLAWGLLRILCEPRVVSNDFGPEKGALSVNAYPCSGLAIHLTPTEPSDKSQHS